jgi:hypothetical protein|tara:strand:+ start:640 stop:963 length:324 start_codon:yes stop_codon:yes gene_type:complete
MYKLYYDKIILWGFIWILLVSLLDHYLTIKLQDSILQFEWNPLGVFLIEADRGSVALFMTLKMAFLWPIAAIILWLYQFNKKFAYTAIISLSFVQALLILFFLCGQR